MAMEDEARSEGAPGSASGRHGTDAVNTPGSGSQPAVDDLARTLHSTRINGDSAETTPATEAAASGTPAAASSPPRPVIQPPPTHPSRAASYASQQASASGSNPRNRNRTSTGSRSSLEAIGSSTSAATPGSPSNSRRRSSRQSLSGAQTYANSSSGSNSTSAVPLVPGTDYPEPTSVPTPGRPLLRDGKLLVMPPTWENCPKCEWVREPCRKTFRRNSNLGSQFPSGYPRSYQAKAQASSMPTRLTRTTPAGGLTVEHTRAFWSRLRTWSIAQ